MLSRLTAGLRRLAAAVTGIATRLVGRWRRAWPAHVARVATDPAYAAAAAAILAGMLGLIQPREVLAAVLTAAISVLLRSRPDDGGTLGDPIDPERLM